MAKIDRYNGNLKAFASEATGNERTIFGDTAQSDTLDANITLDLLRGWGVIGVDSNPTKQHFNGLAFTLGQLISYLHQRGVPEWNTAQEYFDGSVVTTDVGVYRLKTGGDGSSDPDTDGGVNWELIPTQAKVDAKAAISGQAFSGNISAPNLSGTNTGDQSSVSGNAGSATVLQTARSIGGVSFNGSSAINLPGVNTAGNQNTSGNAATVSNITTSQVGSATAGLAAGAVGTYAILLRLSDNASISTGSTYAGSGLRYSGFNGSVGSRGILSGEVGGAPAGSWRAMGHASSASGTYPATVFLRIS